CTGYFLYWVFFVLGIFCTGYFLYWVFFVLGIFCTGYFLYWVFFVLGIFCTRHIFYRHLPKVPQANMDPLRLPLLKRKSECTSPLGMKRLNIKFVSGCNLKIQRTLLSAFLGKSKFFLTNL